MLIAKIAVTGVQAASTKLGTLTSGMVYRSKVDNNVHAPSAWPEGWETVEEG